MTANLLKAEAKLAAKGATSVKVVTADDYDHVVRVVGTRPETDEEFQARVAAVKEERAYAHLVRKVYAWRSTDHGISMLVDDLCGLTDAERKKAMARLDAELSKK